MLLVIDIDGTIADNNKRFEMLKGKEHYSNEDILKVMDAMLVMQDPPIKEAQEVLKNLHIPNCDIYFITGRNEYLREVTKKWLDLNFNIQVDDSNLIMRPSGELSYATEYKERSLRELLLITGRAKDVAGHLINKETIIFIDDDPFVLNMYSKYGLALRAPDCWKILIHTKPLNKEPLFGK